MASEIITYSAVRPDWIYMARQAEVKSIKITQDFFDMRAPTYPTKGSPYYYEIEQQPCPKIEWVEESGRIAYAYIEPGLYRVEKVIEVHYELFMKQVVDFIRENKNKVTEWAPAYVKPKSI